MELEEKTYQGYYEMGENNLLFLWSNVQNVNLFNKRTKS